jgi:hypothetical protein
MLKKGTKFEDGYSTAKNGADYRKISKILEEEHGICMNHVSVRNYSLRALSIIASSLANSLGEDVNEEEICKSPLFHEAIAEILIKFY